ncbi:hypothetical protein QQF64_000298 [Cirrhinus molitorella]|uniref:Uncharacterized protein n=1 Tax=Cirrhinus molitorella TaxID=172907 RepID=A0ABR3NX88_9TELE
MINSGKSELTAIFFSSEPSRSMICVPLHSVSMATRSSGGGVNGPADCHLEIRRGFFCKGESQKIVQGGHFNQHARARSDVTRNFQLLKIRADRHLFSSAPSRPTSRQDIDIHELCCTIISGSILFSSFIISDDTSSLSSQTECFAEPGSTSGWYGWKHSIKFKMGNYRQKLKGVGCRELEISPGRDSRSLEEDREKMVQEMKKTTPNLAYIDDAMNATYALRRQEIVEEEPPVAEMRVRWPALFTEDRYAKEFTRLTSMDINKFYEGLDSHLHKLLQLFRLKRFEEVQDMTSLMESLDKDPTDPGEDFIKGMVIGILLVVEDVKEPLPVSYNDVAIVIEERLSCVILVMYPMLL